MADSDALRMRRSRRHKAGDHSLCVRCSVLRAAPEAVSAPAQVLDAAEGLRLLAGQLTVAYGADTGNALLARELRMTLQALLAGQGSRSTDGDLASLFAELGAS